MQNIEIEFLVKLGIPEKAASIYIVLLDRGDAGISDIAEHAELHRPDVYRYIPILLEKKLVSEIQKGKRTVYRALDPIALESIRDEFVTSSEVMLERLKGKHEAKSLKAHLSHMKGIRAISQIYVDAMRLTPSGQSYLRYSSWNVIYDRSMYSTPEYESLKKRKDVGRIVIANSYFRKRKFANDPTRELNEIPEEYGAFDDNISKMIFADRVAIIDHDQLEAFVIESERFAEYERKIFLFLRRLLREKKENWMGE